MLNNTLLSSLLVSSTLFSISSAHAGKFDKWENIEINHYELYRASVEKNPTLTLEDGTKFSIKNFDASGNWDFYVMADWQKNKNVLILKTQNGYEFIYSEVFELPAPTESVTWIPRAYGQYIDRDVDGRPLQFRNEPPSEFVPELDASRIEPAVPTQYYLGEVARLRLEPFVELVEGLSTSPFVTVAREDLEKVRK